MACLKCLDTKYQKERKINKKIEKEINKYNKALDKDFKLLMLGELSFVFGLT